MEQYTKLNFLSDITYKSELIPPFLKILLNFSERAGLIRPSLRSGLEDDSERSEESRADNLRRLLAEDDRKLCAH
jgi:hypothetical protein